MRPPGHSGKAKKGHLCFDAIYETGFLNALFCSSGDHKPKKLHLQIGNVLGAWPFSNEMLVGNLGRVDFINDYEYDLFVRPDTCNPRYR